MEGLFFFFSDRKTTVSPLMGKFPYVREKPIMSGRGENCWGAAVGELGGLVPSGREAEPGGGEQWRGSQCGPLSLGSCFLSIIVTASAESSGGGGGGKHWSSPWFSRPLCGAGALTPALQMRKSRVTCQEGAGLGF